MSNLISMEVSPGPVASLPTPKIENRKVIFIQGIDSKSLNSDCDKVGFLDEQGDNKVQWLVDGLTTGGDENALVTGLSGSEDFFYFSYSADYCKGIDGRNDYRKPKYQGTDTCGGVRSAADGLHLMVSDIIKKHPDAKIDVIAHSMGGLVVSQWLSVKPDMRSRVNSVVTFDSPLRGSAVMNVYPFSACLATSSPSSNDIFCLSYTSLVDLCASEILPAIAAIGSDVPFYTIDATSILGLVPGDRTTLLGSTSKLHCRFNNRHSSVWDTEKTDGGQ